jgi:hypothetical protein
VKELGFTDFQAYQRIQAMRALRELPELKAKIESGALSVSSVSKVQTHFRKERRAGIARAPDEKLDLFLAMENLTSKEVDAKLAEVRGEDFREKLVLEMDEELAELWRRVKDLAAHRSGGDGAETLKIVAREWLERNDPLAKPVRKGGKEKIRRAVPCLTRIDARPSSEDESSGEPVAASSGPIRDSTETGSEKEGSRFIPSGLRRKIWDRDRGECVRCGSTYALEIDHIRPFAFGGKTKEENLRLVCRSCNEFFAVESFGADRIARAKVEGGRRKKSQKSPRSRFRGFGFIGRSKRR